MPMTPGDGALERCYRPNMTSRSKGWLLAIAASLSLWGLAAIASHEALMIWDQVHGAYYHEHET